MDDRNGTGHERLDPTTPVLDREAFTDLFDLHFRPLAAYARRFVGAEATACDVVQDVFVKLWEHRDRIKVRVSMQALLYTMVRNRALNVRRDRRRVRLDVAAEDAYDEEAGETHEEAELRRTLYRWIHALPDRRREAFMLSRFHDLTHAEIADIMGVSERTVDTHILLALRSLREQVDRMRQEDTQA